MCSGAKIAEAEFADNCREKRQLDFRGKKLGAGTLELKRALGALRALLRAQLQEYSLQDESAAGTQASMVGRQ